MAKFTDNTFIQVRISESTVLGQFNDSLYFTPNEFVKITDKDIQGKITERVDNWVNFINEQKNKPVVQPTEEELIRQKEDLESQIVSLTAQKTEIAEKISTLQAPVKLEGGK
jgi:hypothetical protein